MKWNGPCTIFFFPAVDCEEGQLDRKVIYTTSKGLRCKNIHRKERRRLITNKRIGSDIQGENA